MSLMTNDNRWTVVFWLFLCLIALNIHGPSAKILQLSNDRLKILAADNGEIKANFSTQYDGLVNSGNQDVYKFRVDNTKNESYAIRVHVNSTNAVVEYPVLFVVRQQRGVMSWPVPMYILSQYKYSSVARTLCPFDMGDELINDFYIDVSCASVNFTDYTLYATIVHDFQMSMNELKSLSVSPSKPEYYYFLFPEGVEAVHVIAKSKDHICATLSVQDISCPVFDQNRNVEFTGIYQTLTQQASITVQRDDFDGRDMFIVVVIHPDDAQCAGIINLQPAMNNPNPDLELRLKNLTVTIEATISSRQYWIAISVIVAFFALFYIIGGVVILVQEIRTSRRDEELLHSGESEPFLGNDDTDIEAPIANEQHRPHYGTTELQDPFNKQGGADNGGTSHHHHRHRRYQDSDDSSIDEDEIDMLHDIEEEKDIYRTKTFLYVSDLARKDRKALRKKYKLYHWNLLPISVFYALPVIQLVITYQTMFNVSGDEDICYYNFLCANPLGVISAFNNLFSNIGYILLGILFLIVIWREDAIHKKAVERNDEFEKGYGIPKHFGLFYAIGIALIMEGFLSGCYHVCPTYSNFQFDTSFMYIIAGLGMLKLYQTRHPDINANAYVAYACFALIIFLAVMGVVFGTLLFWVVFAVVHIVTCCVLSAQIYYMGRWKLDLGIFKRIYLVMKTDCLHCTRPIYMDRMILLIIGNVINWSFAILGVISQPKDFASFLLAIFIVNSMLYLAFYIIMKLRNNERIVPRAGLFICLTLAFWAAALYFFMQGLAQWDKTPAVSREGNRECILLDFYDFHDVWHFLSACAMFFSFMTLLTLDDDLDRVPRTKIPVF
ncbi:SID1 transmembrane family member 1-like [Saccoglossus kowalevskii]